MKTSARRKEQAPETEPRLPLFYREPRPVSSIDHADWRLKPGDYAFAASTAFVPVVAGELSLAFRDYPIVFAGAEAMPVAILGLEQANLFVSGGEWEADTYVPAYVRRYPFGFLSTPDPQGFVLGLDVASERIARGGDEGLPLFEDGKPTDMLREALQFCDAFQGEAEATKAFSQALMSENVLVERRADATLPDGRQLALQGFRIVDPEALHKLPDAVVVEWHRKGWLAMAQLHLASLERFPALLGRREKANR